MTTGPNSSVRLGDSNMVWTRLRHMPPKRAAKVRLTVPEALSVPKAGKQLVLGDGESASDWVMGPPGIGQDFELITYWWETPGRLSVAGGILTVVEEFNTAEERIVAYVDLPPAIRPKTRTEIQLGAVRDEEEDRQFDERFPQIRAENEESGA